MTQFQLGSVSPWPEPRQSGQQQRRDLCALCSGPGITVLIPLCPRHACVPVDFEEVHVSSTADEEDIRNAIMAIRRNRVALKGETPL